MQLYKLKQTSKKWIVYILLLFNVTVVQKILTIDEPLTIIWIDEGNKTLKKTRDNCLNSYIKNPQLKFISYYSFSQVMNTQNKCLLPNTYRQTLIWISSLYLHVNYKCTHTYYIIEYDITCVLL